LVDEHRRTAPPERTRIVIRPAAVDDAGFSVSREVSREGDVYVVTGRPERWVRQTNFDNDEAVGYLADRLARLRGAHGPGPVPAPRYGSGRRSSTGSRRCTRVRISYRVPAAPTTGSRARRRGCRRPSARPPARRVGCTSTPRIWLWTATTTTSRRRPRET